MISTQKIQEVLRMDRLDLDLRNGRSFSHSSSQPLLSGAPDRAPRERRVSFSEILRREMAKDPKKRD